MLSSTWMIWKKIELDKIRAKYGKLAELARKDLTDLA